MDQELNWRHTRSVGSRQALLLGGRTWNDVMVAILDVWRRIKNLLIDEYNRAKFYPNPMWNDSARAFLRESPQQEQEQ